ncbi:MAG: hypothetical protein ACM3PS_17625, partial [Syntrophothermus sp.]
MSEENQNPGQYPLGEPSVLDYVKSLLRFSRGERIHIPDGEQAVVNEQPSAVSQQDLIAVAPAEQVMEEARGAPNPETSQPENVSPAFPWRSLLALFLGLIGQKFFEPPPTNYPLGYVFYIGAFILLAWSIRRGEWNLYPLAPLSQGNDPQTYRPVTLIISLLLGISAFLLLGNNLFTALNFILWIAAVISFLWSFWLRRTRTNSVEGYPAAPEHGGRKIRVSIWTVLLVLSTMVIFFFRFYQTQSVPPEPFSDHAEKILDVYDVSQGQTHIFFPRNTGREAIQMYWTLLVAKVFGTGLSFLSLKLGTAILGFLTLPFIYLLGREVGGK